MKPAGKPDAGNRHVRFDERGWETGRWPKAQATAPILDSTKCDVVVGTLSLVRCALLYSWHQHMLGQPIADLLSDQLEGTAPVSPAFPLWDGRTPEVPP